MHKLFRILVAFLIAIAASILVSWFSFSAGSEAVRSLTKPWISFSFSPEMLSYIAMEWIIYWSAPLLAFVLFSQWRHRTTAPWYIGGGALISSVVAALLDFDMLIDFMRQGLSLGESAEAIVYYLSALCAGVCFGFLYWRIAIS